MSQPLEHAFRALRTAMGRPLEPSSIPKGEALTFLIHDVSVTSTLAHHQGQCSDTLSIRYKQTGTAKAGDWPGWDPAVAVLWGVTAAGNSVCCRVHGFRPWCYVRVPTKQACSAVVAYLNSKRSKYECVLEQHYNFAGFQYDAAKGDRVKHKYLKVRADSVAAYNQLKKLPDADALQGHDIELVELHGVPLYSKFFSDTGLSPNGWVAATATRSTEFTVSTCDYELVTKMDALAPVECMDVAPLLVASCDIEAYSSTGKFPSAELPGDVCFMINASFRRITDPISRATHTCFIFDDTLATPYAISQERSTDGAVHVFRFSTEVAMIRAWRDCVCVYLDADVVMWYNGFRFDLPFLYRRALSGGDPTARDSHFDGIFQTSKFLRLTVPLKVKQQQSSAMGKNEYTVPLEEHGRLTMDLYDRIAKQEKLSSYKLARVCEEYLTVRGGRVSWSRGTTAVTGTGLAQLQAGDAVKLGSEFYPLASVTGDGEAHLTKVPYDIDDDVRNQPLVGRVSKIDLTPQEMFALYEERDFGPIIDYCTRDCVAPLLLLDNRRYYMNDHQMALVTMTPVKDLWGRGAGIKGVNLVVKFAHERGFVLNQADVEMTGKYQGAFVLEPDVGFHECPVVTLDFASLYPSIMISQSLCWTTVVLDPAYDNLPGIEYNTIEVSEGVSYRFAANVPTVAPELEKLLLATRRATKKQMGAESDPSKKALLDAKQLAEKITCNAMYGLTGADTGILRCKPVAASITSFGRQELLRTKAFVESLQYDFYGSGVSPAQVVGSSSSGCGGNSGIPSNVIYGDSVTPDTPILCRFREDGMHKVVYRTIDQLGDGNWVVNAHGKEECAPLPGYEVWSDVGFTAIKRVIRHACGKPLKRVITRTGIVDVTTDHSLLTPEGNMVKPTDVTVGQTLLHADLPDVIEYDSILSKGEAFMWGLYYDAGYGSVPHPELFVDSSGRKKVPDCIISAPHDIREEFFKACVSKFVRAGGKLASATLCQLAASLGKRLAVYCSRVEPDTFYVVQTRRTHQDAIRAIHDLPAYSGYVYDLETDNHHFAAGIGRLVVHNTDSVMIKFTDLPGTMEGKCEAWRRGEIMAKDITERLGHGIILECEKVYCPYLLLKKKKYAGIKYEGDPAVVTPVRDDKGLDLKQRSTSVFCRTAQRRILDCLLNHADKIAALKIVAQHMSRLAHNQLTVDEVSSSSSLADEYKGNVMQDVVNKRRAAYMPGSEYKPGERIPMVAVERRDAQWGKPTKPGTKAVVACDVMEDVDIAKATGATLHREYYAGVLLKKVTNILYDEVPALTAMMECVKRHMTSVTYQGTYDIDAELDKVIQLRTSGHIKSGVKKVAKRAATALAPMRGSKLQAINALFGGAFKRKKQDTTV